MKKPLFGVILPVGIFAVLLILNMALLFRIPEKDKLVGVTLAPYPNELSFETVLNGEFQEKFGKWFNDNFAGQTRIVKYHNQIEYSIFKDGIGDWIQGKDGYLFSKSQTYNFTAGAKNKRFTWEQMEAYAKKILNFQTSLGFYGKDFLYIINPVKAEIYPDYLPWNERVLLKTYVNYGERNAELMKAAFDKYGVNYYDTTDDLKKMRMNNKYDVFSKTGHHWTLLATANEMNMIFQHVEGLGDENGLLDVPTLDTTDKVFETDKDILNLQNVYKGRLSDIYSSPLINYRNRIPMNVYLYGTSFCTELVNVLYDNIANRAFNKVVYQQYFGFVSTYDQNGKQQVNYKRGDEISSLGIMKNIRDSDIIIIESQATNGLLNEHIKFLDYVNDNMDDIYYHIGDSAVRYGDNSNNVMLENFCGLAELGRWTMGDSCKIHLYGNELKKEGTDINAEFEAYSYHAGHEVDVLWNGNYITTIDIPPERHSYAIAIPQELIDESENVIEFCLHGEIYSPNDLGESKDYRYLGLRFVDISFLGSEQ